MTHRGPFQPLPFCDSVTPSHPYTAVLTRLENAAHGRHNLPRAGKGVIQH